MTIAQTPTDGKPSGIVNQNAQPLPSTFIQPRADHRQIPSPAINPLPAAEKWTPEQSDAARKVRLLLGGKANSPVTSDAPPSTKAAAAAAVRAIISRGTGR
jgi:hypothetical protein